MAQAKATLCLFLLKADAADGGSSSLLHRGAECRLTCAAGTLGGDAASLVHEVVFNYSPDSGDDVESEVAVPMPNVARGPVQQFSRLAADDRIGYAMSRPLSRQQAVTITVHWSAEVVSGALAEKRLGRCGPAAHRLRPVSLWQHPAASPAARRTPPPPETAPAHSAAARAVD